MRPSKTGDAGRTSFPKDKLMQKHGVVRNKEKLGIAANEVAVPPGPTTTGNMLSVDSPNQPTLGMWDSSEGAGLTSVCFSNPKPCCVKSALITPAQAWPAKKREMTNVRILTYMGISIQIGFSACKAV